MLCMSVQVRTHVHIQVRVHTRVLRARPHTTPSPRPFDVWREEGRVTEREPCTGASSAGGLLRGPAGTEPQPGTCLVTDLLAPGPALTTEPRGPAERLWAEETSCDWQEEVRGLGPSGSAWLRGGALGPARPPRVRQSPRRDFSAVNGTAKTTLRAPGASPAITSNPITIPHRTAGSGPGFIHHQSRGQ